jgi:hypothetical protein
MGVKNRMDLSVFLAIGSSIQIALFVAPVLVLASYFIAPSPSIWCLTGPLGGRILDRFDRRHGGRRREIQLVQGGAVNYRLRYHGRHVVFSARLSLKSREVRVRAS